MKSLWCAKIYKQWILDAWNQVLWSDDSKFEVIVSKQRGYSSVLRRRAYEKMIDDCLTQWSQWSIKVKTWWSGNALTMGQCVICIVCRASSIIMNTTPYWRGMPFHLGNNWLGHLQQDKDPKRFSELCKNCRESSWTTLMVAWPSQPPNLDPIDPLWGKLDCRVWEHCPASTAEPGDRLQEAWEESTCEYLQNWSVEQLLLQRCRLDLSKNSFPNFAIDFYQSFLNLWLDTCKENELRWWATYLHLATVAMSSIC